MPDSLDPIAIPDVMPHSQKLELQKFNHLLGSIRLKIQGARDWTNAAIINAAFGAMQKDMEEYDRMLDRARDALYAEFTRVGASATELQTKFKTRRMRALRSSLNFEAARAIFYDTERKRFDSVVTDRLARSRLKAKSISEPEYISLKYTLSELGFVEVDDEQSLTLAVSGEKALRKSGYLANFLRSAYYFLKDHVGGCLGLIATIASFAGYLGYTAAGQ